MYDYIYDQLKYLLWGCTIVFLALGILKFTLMPQLTYLEVATPVIFGNICVLLKIVMEMNK